MATPYLQYGQDGLSGYDSNGVRRIWLNPATLRFSFLDTDGVTPRCEIGNLPARGVSPAHWGFRVSDATGAPIYDSQGLIAVMKPLATGDAVQNTNYTSNGTVTLSAPASANFTLTRPARILVLATMAGVTVGASGNVATATINDNSPGPGGPGVFGNWDKRNSGQVQYTTWYLAGPIPAGSYSSYLLVGMDAGQTFTCIFAHFDVFLLGG